MLIKTNDFDINELEKYDVKRFLNMSLEEKKKFLTDIRKQLLDYGNKYSNNITLVQRGAAISGLPFLVDFEFEDKEAINDKENYLFCLNHSNAYDGIVAAKTTTKLKSTCKFLAEDKDKTFFQKLLFLGVGSTMIDRTDKKSSTVGLYDFISKLINGSDGVIFVEGSWNLHPTRLMQEIKIGGPYASALSGTKVIPVIFEYEKSEKPVEDPKKLFKKCTVVIGKPIAMDPLGDLKEQTKKLKEEMIEMRKRFRIRHDKKILTMEDIDPAMYVYEMYIIKFLSGLTKFDAVSELDILRKVEDKDGNLIPPDNEYCLTNNGLYVPKSQVEESQFTSDIFIPGSTLEEPGKAKTLYLYACESYYSKH